MAETLEVRGQSRVAGGPKRWRRLDRDSPRRRIPPTLVSIAAGCSFEGLLTFRGETRVEGELVGEVVAAGTLWLGERSRVRARIEVDELIVAGELIGDVVARNRIELAAGARVSGSIQAPKLFLAEGCVFRGRCRCIPLGCNDPLHSLPSP